MILKELRISRHISQEQLAKIFSVLRFSGKQVCGRNFAICGNCIAENYNFNCRQAWRYCFTKEFV